MKEPSAESVSKRHGRWMRSGRNTVAARPYRALHVSNDLLTLAGILVTLSISLSIAIPLQGDPQPDEYLVKAAYIYHFAELIEWPSDALNAGSRTVDLCIFGEDPFHGDLENIVEGKRIGTRIIQVRHIKKNPLSEHCQIIFVGKNEDRRIPSLLMELRDAPVVTVGETETFVQQGGVIRFCLEGNKLRFEINLQAAEGDRLKISSRLLQLAKNVYGRTPNR